MPKQTVMPRARLFGLSFLMLFTELALIRWTGANIVYLSYFSNFVLLGSFLGIGLGFLRARSRVDLFRWAPVALALLILFVLVFPVQVSRGGGQLLFFTSVKASGPPTWVSLPVIFLVVALVMMMIGEGVARTFALFPPLEAYRLDILGSLTGIAAFSLLSFIDAQPWAWGLITVAVLALMYGKRIGVIQILALLGVLGMLAAESASATDIWSPYYRLTVLHHAPNYEIEANGLTKKGAKNPAAKQFLDWAITDESLKIASQFFAAVSVPGFPVPEGLPKDISKVVFPNDFDWSAKNRDRILAEWQKRYSK